MDLVYLHHRPPPRTPLPPLPLPLLRRHRHHRIADERTEIDLITGRSHQDRRVIVAIGQSELRTRPVVHRRPDRRAIRRTGMARKVRRLLIAVGSRRDEVIGIKTSQGKKKIRTKREKGTNQIVGAAGESQRETNSTLTAKRRRQL